MTAQRYMHMGMKINGVMDWLCFVVRRSIGLCLGRPDGVWGGLSGQLTVPGMLKRMVADPEGRSGTSFCWPSLGSPVNELGQSRLRSW